MVGSLSYHLSESSLPLLEGLVFSCVVIAVSLSAVAIVTWGDITSKQPWRSSGRWPLAWSATIHVVVWAQVL